MIMALIAGGDPEEVLALGVRLEPSVTRNTSTNSNTEIELQ